MGGLLCKTRRRLQARWWHSSTWPRSKIQARKFCVADILARRFWHRLHRGFGANVSARKCRHASFSTVVSATSKCHVRERHIVHFRNDTSSSLEKTRCHLWKRHIIHFGKDTSSFLESTHNDTLTSLETAHCPLRKRQIVLCEDTYCLHKIYEACQVPGFLTVAISALVYILLVLPILPAKT